MGKAYHVEHNAHGKPLWLYHGFNLLISVERACVHYPWMCCTR